ncbi:MAG: HNH endonuclease [Actinobacteria bacterium]|jgi:5-methylcytosine-specific restriction endonuclease McrA|nr:HNH endonuclease [Actinomycetota bacterium]
MHRFAETRPRLEDYWRSVILFGRNVATFKFALGASLLELSDLGMEFVTLEDLASPFSRHLCEHLKLADRQGTSPRSRFLDTCRAHNRGEVSTDELVTITARMGFVNVIDAFHVVGPGPVPVRFYVDERKTKGGIRLTENLERLRERFQYQNLPHEVEARWRLVETAWDLNMPRHALAVDVDEANRILVVHTHEHGRRDITGCREALNGYQKGTCFYCSAPITTDQQGLRPAHVDHFLPHTLKTQGFGRRNLDGIWNLVLACVDCNLKKSARVPALPLLERLHTRNEFLISSHHPLRETLMSQTGTTEFERRAYLQQTHADATMLLIHQWQPTLEEEPTW